MWHIRVVRRTAALAFVATVATSCASNDASIDADVITTAATTATASTSVTSTTIAVTIPPTTTSTSTTTTSTTTSTSTSTSTTTTTPEPSADAESAFADLETTAQKLLSSSSDLAVSLAVAHDVTAVHQAAFARNDGAVTEPITPATRFRLASAGKVITSIVVMQLVQDGAIELDRPFVDYLPTAGPPSDSRVSEVTVRQLLSHTSGLPPDRNSYFGGGSPSWRYSAVHAFGATLLSQPGTAFRYSNSNFCLLGLVIEQVTGTPYEGVVAERVSRPLDIGGMRLAATIDSGDGDAPYRSSAGRTYMEALGPAGAWIASAPDIAVIYNSLAGTGGGYHPLSEQSVELMRTPVPLTTPGKTWTYGYGMMLFGDSWGHTGTIEQARTMVVTLPNGYTISILVSGSSPRDGEALLAYFSRAISQVALLD